jgi:Arc/MetJ family transcription regulator
MKVTVEIDERLLTETMELAGIWTQRSAIETALRELLIRLRDRDLSAFLGTEDGRIIPARRMVRNSEAD